MTLYSNVSLLNHMCPLADATHAATNAMLDCCVQYTYHSLRLDCVHTIQGSAYTHQRSGAGGRCVENLLLFKSPSRQSKYTKDKLMTL